MSETVSAFPDSLRCSFHFPPDMECVKCEAADEIERLRAALKFTQDWLSPVAAQHKDERTIFHDILNCVEEALKMGDSTQATFPDTCITTDHPWNREYFWCRHTPAHGYATAAEALFCHAE